MASRSYGKTKWPSLSWWHLKVIFLKNIIELWFKFQWYNLFLKFQLTISQHWFRYCLGSEQATSRYPNQCWPNSLARICVSWPRWVTESYVFITVPADDNIADDKARHSFVQVSVFIDSVSPDDVILFHRSDPRWRHPTQFVPGFPHQHGG